MKIINEKWENGVCIERIENENEDPFIKEGKSKNKKWWEFWK